MKEKDSYNRWLYDDAAQSDHQQWASETMNNIRQEFLLPQAQKIAQKYQIDPCIAEVIVASELGKMMRIQQQLGSGIMRSEGYSYPFISEANGYAPGSHIKRTFPHIDEIADADQRQRTLAKANKPQNVSIDIDNITVHLDPYPAE